MPNRARRPVPLPVRRSLQELGRDLQIWRKLQGLTAAQVADRAGIAPRTLRSLEQGAGTTSLENALRVARALGVLDQLAKSVDPYASDVGRLRSEERLPKRVRPRRLDR